MSVCVKMVGYILGVSIVLYRGTSSFFQFQSILPPCLLLLHFHSDLFQLCSFICVVYTTTIAYRNTWRCYFQETAALPSWCHLSTHMEKKSRTPNNLLFCFFSGNIYSLNSILFFLLHLQYIWCCQPVSSTIYSSNIYMHFFDHTEKADDFMMFNITHCMHSLLL